MARLKDPTQWWLATPTGDRLHAPDLDAAPYSQTLCGAAVVATGRTHLRTPRCQLCCLATGIPTGIGPPVLDNRARRRLGLEPL